jgi:inorganic pyrophosphatase
VEIIFRVEQRLISHQYKDLEPGKWVKISGWEGADVAKAEVLKAIEAAK